MEAYQSIVIPDAGTFGLYQSGEAVVVYTLAYPDWEDGFSEGSEIEVCLISNGIDWPRFNGVVLKNYGKAATIPDGQPYALKLLVKRV